MQETLNSTQSSMQTSPKNIWIYFLLLFLTGRLGIHRFYLNKIVSGIIYFFTGGLFGLGILYDFICLLFPQIKDKENNVLIVEFPIRIIIAIFAIVAIVVVLGITIILIIYLSYLSELLTCFNSGLAKLLDCLTWINPFSDTLFSTMLQ